MANTLYWHDYETFGIDPRRDRASQFAGIRTNDALEEVGEPLVMYCKPAPDMLPHPEACLVTGITPQKALADGLCEAEFIRRIHNELSVPGTCTVGYNSIRFDDEMTRQLLYRNFFDPYEREWKNGNSRWDVIDMVRLCHAVRPEGINWPTHDDGVVSFRLEALTTANSIAHEGAHDALSDVRATIALARLVRQQQPKLYDYAFGLRRKQTVMEMIDLANHKPLLHVSSMYPARLGALAPVVPICRHPRDNNGIIVYDLRKDPSDWLTLSPAAIQARLFVAQADLPEGTTRIPLKTLHINRSPMLVPLATLDDSRAGRFEVNMDECRRHWQLLVGTGGLAERLAEVFQPAPADTQPGAGDPDFMLYEGGFFSDHDKREMSRLRATAPEALAETRFDFQDTRLPEMLFRYRARNYPETLDQHEQQRWRNFCVERLSRECGAVGAGMGWQEFQQAMKRLQEERVEQHEINVLNALQEYAVRLLPGR